eukprot:CAMPEP_0117437922 /NCGR_PEP_ID=MMETSP0759-20121206/1782_1 /TAXON_ID=63605 /ORGANISM="Percolomonas cosmopolitus, Strain WS" /LENGTH=571 /DNA_ID=CAMNT_0005229587 /DNA_START=38 /DNA_END=1750 /DNA_ORIENTATION=-
MNSKDIDIHLIPNTNVLIDGFKHRKPIDTAISPKNTYILTHFHSDHYSGITKRWNYGKIYCSEITGRLVQWKFGLPNEALVLVQEGEEVSLPECNLTFQFVPANHCPGSMMVLVRQQGKTYLHTGDFRFHPPAVLKSAALHHYLKPEFFSWIPNECNVTDTSILKQLSFDKVYLDTTYCHPKRIFPHQQHAMDFVANVCKMKMDHAKKNNKKVLVIVGSYTIGKERIVKAIAEKCNVKVFAKNQSSESPIHFVDMRDLNWKRINEVVKFHQNSVDEFLVIKPSAMMREANPPKPGHCKVSRSKKITTICVPYSEHSSFHELRKFMECFNVKEVIPTVYSNQDHYLRQVQYLTERDFNVPELGPIPIPDTLRPDGGKKSTPGIKGTLLKFFTPRKSVEEKKVVENDTPHDSADDDLWSVNSGGDGSLSFSLTPTPAGSMNDVGEDVFKIPHSAERKTKETTQCKPEIVDLTEVDVDEQMEIMTMIGKKKQKYGNTTTSAEKSTSQSFAKTSTKPAIKKKFRITKASNSTTISTKSSLTSHNSQASSKKRKAEQEIENEIALKKQRTMFSFLK